MSRPPAFPRPVIGEDDYHSRVQSWLVAHVLRVLTATPDRPAMLDHQLGTSTPAGQADRTVLVDELIRHAEAKGRRWIAGLTEGSRIAKSEVRDLARKAADAVDFAIAEWKSSTDRVRTWASAAGTKGKRPPVFTLDDIEAAGGLPVKDQAALIGSSIPTVKRLRAALRRIVAQIDPVTRRVNFNSEPLEAVEVRPARKPATSWAGPMPLARPHVETTVSDQHWADIVALIEDESVVEAPVVKRPPRRSWLAGLLDIISEPERPAQRPTALAEHLEERAMLDLLAELDPVPIGPEEPSGHDLLAAFIERRELAGVGR